MIPLTDLYINPKLLERIHRKVISVIDSKSYILGKELANFEKGFADFVGAKFAIGVASGTDALRLSLRSCGVAPGDKVLAVAFTSPFTVIAIIEEGAIPVFVDIDSETMTIDVRDLKNKIDSRTRAIIPVHLYGNPCNMDEIMSIAKKNKLTVIEDACQAHGATYKNKPIGNFGLCGAFSYYPSKNLGGMGDGGMVVTNDANIAKKIRMLRHGGQSKRFWHKFAGMNSRLDEIQAAILSLKLKSLKTGNSRRRKLAKRYRNLLSDLPIKFQESFKGAISVYHLFVIRTNRRSQLKNYLLKKKIVSDIYYPYPVHKQPVFSHFGKLRLPVTETLTKELLAIPLFPSLSFADQDYVIDRIRTFFKK